MSERATRTLFVVAALSAFAAVLASTANAYVPESAGVYAASTSPTVSSEQGAAQALPYHGGVNEQLGEIGAWAVPSISRQKPLSQRTSVRGRLQEIGAWAVPSISHQKPLAQTPLATHPAVPEVDPSTFEGYRG